MNLANKLTMLRVLMIPVYLVLWSLDTAWSGYAALAVFVLASLTDPAWALVIVIFREFAVSGLRLIAVEGGRVIAAGWSGKVKTASTMIGLCVMHLTVPTLVDQLCIWVIVLTTIYSGVEYFIKNKDCIDWKNL